MHSASRRPSSSSTRAHDGSHSQTQFASRACPTPSTPKQRSPLLRSHPSGDPRFAHGTKDVEIPHAAKKSAPTLSSSGLKKTHNFDLQLPSRGSVLHSHRSTPTSFNHHFEAFARDRHSKNKADLGHTTPLSVVQNRKGSEASPQKFSVIIDNSQREWCQDETNELIRSFQRPPPTAETKARRLDVFKELKSGTIATRNRASSVEALFGNHGLSNFYCTDRDTTRMKNLAQRKSKKVARKSIKLEWGEPYVLSGKPRHHTKFVTPRNQARDILGSKFDHRLSPSVTFINEANDRQLSGKFEFIKGYIKREGIRTVETAKNYGCECNGICNPESCGCSSASAINPYYVDAKGLVVLRDGFIQGSRQEIIECNPFCGCDDTCWNRMAQRGRIVPLQIFTTQKCGFGMWFHNPINPKLI